MRFPLPGSPCQSDHLVVPATAAEAPMASHSFGERTATRLPLTTSWVVGQAFGSSFPTETSVEPSVFGRTIRALSIPGKPHVGDVGRLAGHDRRDRRHRLGRADHCVLVDRLGRRGAADGDAVQRRAGDRDRQLQHLVLDQVAVAHGLAAARDDAVRDGEVAGRHAELRRGEPEQRLVGERGDLLEVGRPAAEEAGADAAVRCAVGVAHDHGGDRRVRNVELLGDDLGVGGARRTLAELELAGPDRDRVVGVDRQPALERGRVDLVLPAAADPTATPDMLSATTSAPVPLTNVLRLNVAPNTSLPVLSLAVISLPSPSTWPRAGWPP